MKGQAYSTVKLQSVVCLLAYSSYGTRNLRLYTSSFQLALFLFLGVPLPTLAIQSANPHPQLSSF